MAFSGGIFTRIYSWISDKNNSIAITASRMDSEMDGMATGLSTCMLKDGTQIITADIPMASHKFTGLSAGAAATDSVNVGQVQSGFTWCGTAGGTANAITLTPTPAITATAAGQSFVFKSGASPNTAATTIAISGLATIALQYNGAACIGGEVLASKWYRITLDAATTCQLEAISTQLPFIDTLPVVRGSGDNTKQLRFEVDGFTTATTRVATFPDADINVAPLASPTFSGTPAAPTATAATSTTQLATTAFVQSNIGYKVGTFTRDTTLASGTQAVTGVGFLPKAVIFLANQSTTKEMSVGIDDGTTNACIYQTSTAGTFNLTTNSIVDDEASGSASYSGAITTLGADGFTITWTKVGSPSGTLTVYYLALR